MAPNQNDILALKNKFRMYDLTRDGKLSLKEFLELNSDDGVPCSSLLKVFKQYDADRDEQLSPSEYLKASFRDDPESGRISMIIDQFDASDTDHDGSVTIDSIIESLLASLRKILLALDLDHDNNIDVFESVASYYPAV
ncbi:EF-hand domain-containing protein [Streptomyces goshikiensis]|uniref:EF-hand domain-containing protein n=1 Tax=Streptomyces goshikiensis TaxID=1942 RepID=UPI0036C99C7C